MARSRAFTCMRRDALKVDLRRCCRPRRRRWRIVGNLPYNVSTPLLFHLLDQYQLIEDLHVMLQREVVERMAAAPGGRDYGRLTVMLAPVCGNRTPVRRAARTLSRRRRRSGPTVARVAHAHASPHLRSMRALAAWCRPRSPSGARRCATRCGRTGCRHHCSLRDRPRRPRRDTDAGAVRASLRLPRAAASFASWLATRAFCWWST